MIYVEEMKKLREENNRITTLAFDGKLTNFKLIFIPLGGKEPEELKGHCITFLELMNRLRANEEIDFSKILVAVFYAEDSMLNLRQDNDPASSSVLAVAPYLTSLIFKTHKDTSTISVIRTKHDFQGLESKIEPLELKDKLMSGFLTLSYNNKPPHPLDHFITKEKE